MQTLPDTWELHTLLLDKINAPPIITFDYDVNGWINNLQNRKCKKRFLHPLSESFEDTIIMNIKKVLDEMSQEEIENITSFKVLLNNFQVRNILEKEMNCSLKQHKLLINEQVLNCVCQLDPPSLV